MFPDYCFTGVFVSSWLGGFLLWLGEWFIKHVPLVKHIYSASKQISQALNPAVDNAPAFRFEIDHQNIKKIKNNVHWNNDSISKT
jgi:uncharacterized membrane protein